MKLEQTADARWNEVETMLKIWDSTLVKRNGSKERYENQVKLMKKKQEEAKYERTMNTSALFWNFKLETCKKWRKMQMNEKQYITLKFWSGEYPFKSRKKWQKAITKDEFENFELSKANSKLSLLVQNH